MRSSSSKVTCWARWLATFIGFPLGGVVARLIVGNIDGVGAAAIGGIAAGMVLGATQAIVGGIPSGDRLRWSVATALGFGTGLAAGASVVGYRTDTSSLVVMGAICGAAVGLSQGLALPMRAVDRFLWICTTPVLWATGWLITSQVIVDVERQHAVFGASGALFVSAVAGILVAFRRTHSHSSITSDQAFMTAGAS